MRLEVESLIKTMQSMVFFLVEDWIGMQTNLPSMLCTGNMLSMGRTLHATISRYAFPSKPSLYLTLCELTG